MELEMNTKITLLGLAFALALPAQGLAAKRQYQVTPDRDHCYVVEYVPRTVEENTRGKLVRGESTNWVGDVADGATIRKQHNPALYKKTTRIVEEEHYTMSSPGCAARAR
jgi:hypothetical protein